MITQVALFGGPDDGAQYEVEMDALPAVIRVPHAQTVEVSRSGEVIAEDRPIGVACYVRVMKHADVGHNTMVYGWGGWE